MAALIDTPVGFSDNVDIIRGLITTIIKEESENQAVLTPADADKYALQVFEENWYVWEQLANADGNDAVAPLVNVWLTAENSDPSASNRMQRQKWTATFNVDVYGFGRARSDGGTGQVTGDVDAVAERSRAASQVRKYIAASKNWQLRNRGLVWGTRWADKEYFVPAVEEQPARAVKAVRMSLEVEFSEFSPQFDGDILEFVSIDICQKDPFTGAVELAGEVDIDYTAP